MKKEIAFRWAELLESGQYKQGAGKLKNLSGGHCCLGVLCDMATKQGVGQWEEEQYFTASGDSRSYYPPQDVLSWAGLKSETGSFSEEVQKRLSYLNDIGYSFAEIAETIRENWEML